LFFGLTFIPQILKFVLFRSEEWYRRCREWLLIAGGRRLWELDMDWAPAETPDAVPRLRAFRFQIGLRNYRTPTEHTNGKFVALGNWLWSCKYHLLLA
jgi:hypothetical protein